ncbi:Uncharacterized protein AXF42_Ash009032 [Apostasia shenzhenica]|uniref:Uncharacterized protein n=1 Tax=Apostasia shenzhenica TaxID=1088818 RepID=A0A2I0ADE9_9ASPA|nr:Uncharacterized protein AXF42_Ash009032 [Apostasia shenzhenica]
MPFCYVGKATKIFFFVVALLTAAGLVVGFGFLRHGSTHKARGGNPPSATFPDPIPTDAAAPADAARTNPLSPPTASSVTAPPPPPDSAEGTPVVGVPPPSSPEAPQAIYPQPVSSSPATTTTAAPPTFLAPPAPISTAMSPGHG